MNVSSNTSICAPLALVPKQFDTGKGRFLENSTKFIKEININLIQHVSSLENYISKNSKRKL